MPNPFSFNHKQFNRIFPFYILIDHELKIVSLGKSIKKLYDWEKVNQFNNYFKVPRPLTPINSINDLIKLENHMIILESITSKKLMLRGQFEYLEDSKEMLFVGSPWFDSMEQVKENKLVIDDFARHDPLIDLLHVMKTQEITNQDLKQLISTINEQKNDLKKANKEISDFALFPTQNPDPVIRINFKGDLLRNNPSSQLLDLIEFENKVYGYEEFFKMVSSRIDPNVKRWEFEARSKNKDYSFVCVTVKDEGYINIYGQDITSRILAEKELKIAKRVTEELAQSKQNFFANMSHEIRTPMNAIMGMSRQLQKTSLNESQQDYLDTISNASESLMIIINDVLDLTKLEAGKLLFEKIGFRLNTVMESVLKVMTHKAEEKGLELSNPVVDPQISPIVIGDPNRIKQVLLNLVSNAIKFTEVGGIDIKCMVLEETDNSQTIEISVKDTGIGMEPTFLKSLFQKFSQEDQSVARRYGGTGLGMSICKSLVEEMGGEIIAESEKGKGTNIRLCFSFKKGTVNDLTENERTIINTNSLKDKKILVVDDNEMNRMVATLILTDYGSLVTEVVNGLEAIKQLERNSFDLILMDIQMPLLNGYDATKKIRTELKSHIPIIALTANAIKGEHEKCIKAGMDDYLSKPFEEHQFLQIVSHWLENPKDPTIDLNENKKASSLYSLSKLENIARGNQKFIDKMIQLFVDQTPKSVDELKAAYKAGDNSKVKSIAHRIKPSIDTMGIDILKDEIRTIEKDAGSHPSSEQFEKLISKLDTVINEVAESLQKLTK